MEGLFAFLTLNNVPRHKQAIYHNGTLHMTLQILHMILIIIKANFIVSILTIIILKICFYFPQLFYQIGQNPW